MIFVAKGVFCQNITDKTTSVNDFYSLNPESKKSRNININKHFYKVFNKKTASAVDYNSRIPLNPTSVSVLSADHYTQNFGFFCKKELQFEKATKVLFKFRLGSIQYCDWMEGKRSAGLFPGY